MANDETVNPIQVQKFLKGVDYPASKQELINSAKEQGADDAVVSSLEGMDEERFETPADVSEALGRNP